MNHQDAEASKEIITELLETSSSFESIMPGFKILLEINRGVRKLILDYTLLAAIIGLIPVSLAEKIGLLVLVLLNLKMVLDIRLRWGKPKGKSIQMMVFVLLAFFAAFATAILVRLIFSLIGLVIPLIIVLNGAVGHATLTWVFGSTTNQFFLNATQANSSTLKQLLKIHQTYKKNTSRH